MAQRRMKVYILRYVHDVLREEFVNIGVCLADWDPCPHYFVGYTFLQDWRRFQNFFPGADVSFVRSWCSALEAELSSKDRRNYALLRLDETDSTISVVTRSRAILTAAEPFDELRLVSLQALGPQAVDTSSIFS